MNHQELLRAGDVVRAFGRVCFDEDGSWFQPALPVPAVFDPDPDVSPHWPQGAVRLTGAEEAALLNPHKKGPRSEGYAEITGTWDGSGVTVTASRAVRPPHAIPPEPVPPCPEPASGWGRLDRPRLPSELDRLRASGVVQSVVVTQPGPWTPVAVVTTSDVAAVETLLRPIWGVNICVVQSVNATADLEAARADLHRHHGAWGVYEFGTGAGPSWQVELHATCARLLPELIDWMAAYPTGLISLTPWLSRVPDPTNEDLRRGGHLGSDS